MQLIRQAWRQLKEFSATAGDATYLWPRWIVLRSVGLVYVIIFSGIIAESSALIGARGISPIGEFCGALRGLLPNLIERSLRVPSLFWVSASPAMITALEWGGLAAAIALVLNLWPRMALFGCWLCFLSFVSTWQVFSSSIDDQLMLETALLCIAFAPAGRRPGLGVDSPPRPIGVFMVRWLLFRAMFGSGLIKIVSQDPHWRNLTPMAVMYETSPLPTILGYLDHQLPNAWHLCEIALTMTAELIAPLVAIFGGRRGRWFAFWVWAAFQAGIQLTSSFGWLNTASIALGVVLFDDQMLSAAARRLKLGGLAGWLESQKPDRPVPSPTAWRLYGLRVLLGVHFCLTLYFAGTFFAKKLVPAVPTLRSMPIEFLFRDFKSANVYAPYGSFPPAKHELEFEGSNDGGRTWRPYGFRFKPQQTDRICRFVAPWFPRFEATLQLAVNLPRSLVISRTAALLLEREPDVIHLFRADPFPDRPPTIIRMPVYRFAFTDLATYRKTGQFWQKTYIGEYCPALLLNGLGQIEKKPYSFFDETDTAFETYLSGTEAEARAALIDLATRAEANSQEARQDQRRDFNIVMAAAYLRLAAIYRFEHDALNFQTAISNVIRYSDRLPRFATDPGYLSDKPTFLLKTVLEPMEEAAPPRWNALPARK